VAFAIDLKVKTATRVIEDRLHYNAYTENYQTIHKLDIADMSVTLINLYRKMRRCLVLLLE